MAKMRAAEAAVHVLPKDSIPILCITGQAPRARLYKEDF